MDLARDVFSVLTVFGLLAAALWALRRGAVAGMPRALPGSLKGWSASLPASFTLPVSLKCWPGVRPASGKGRPIETIQRLALTPHHSLHLVRLDGRELVLATHPQGCVLLLETSQGNPGGGNPGGGNEVMPCAQ